MSSRLNLIKYAVKVWLRCMVPEHSVVREYQIFNNQIWDDFWRCDFRCGTMLGCVVFNQDGLYLCSIPLADGSSTIVCKDKFTMKC